MPKGDDFNTVSDFNAVRISLASPEQIRGWSYGEVTKPETINYRTLRPEKDGLFCEKIFGPTRDFECFCGKYKKIRYKGVICDKCGVEVARSKVRRERMGHVDLAAPVSHIWFAKGTPSTMGLLLDISPRSLEQVIYFSRHVVIQVDEDLRAKALKQLEDELSLEIGQREEKKEEEAEKLKSQAQKGEIERDDTVQRINSLNRSLEKDRAELTQEFKAKKEEIAALQPLIPLNSSRTRELSEKYGDIVTTGTGAEAILEILKSLDLETLKDKLMEEVHSTSGQRRKKASKRLRVVEAFRRSGNKPEWMILTVLPVLPPELRPMVQLDGGRFATSDLNDLYRRLINRNNRLRRLMDLEAPEIIILNEKRMLQEAVDSLVDNGRRGRVVTTGGNHKLKSLSDMLRGKQGRFRQNLLGKRVDYSGRSVIVAGPHLKLHQCGLPRRMALELFKPFIMHRLIAQGLAHNIKSARRLVERAKSEVWDILDEVIKERPVLLNRAPTLHRLGIQAFEPVLINGSAIQIHPLVCAAFNADFDGDQMAVHIPLSKMAVKEAREILLSTNNMLLPSSGDPVVAPSLDIVLGCYYLTMMRKGEKGEAVIFSNAGEAKLAYDLGTINLHAEIEVRTGNNGERIKTSVGRILFNDTLPPQLRFFNEVVDKATLKQFVARSHKILGNEATATLLDNIKTLGFHHATISGTSIGMHDIEVPPAKGKLLAEAEEKVAIIENQYRRGLITEDERYTSAVKIWNETTDKFTQIISQSLDRYSGIHMMATSGAKGNITQIRQMAGMRGLMTDPSGKIIDFPIRSSFKEGLSVLEYFISTHGARKGLADTALRTSDSGYLTRRLVDVSQDVIVCEEDCGTVEGVWVSEPAEAGVLPPLNDRLIGRYAANKVVDPKTGNTIISRNEEINEDHARQVLAAKISRVYVRSPLSCQARHGVCQLCYGRDLARGQLIQKGTAVGIIAAQSIGEPGTQLTMRTFHTGGIAGLDITSGLPRVEELFEIRTPKGQAIISEIDGKVEIKPGEGGKKLVITNTQVYREEYPLPSGWEAAVEEAQRVEPGTLLARRMPPPEAEEEEKKEGQLLEREQPLVARVGGRVTFEGQQICLSYEEQDQVEYPLPSSAHLRVEPGTTVKAGAQLTDGHIDPQDILRVMGREAVQRYLVDEVQKVYRSQGVTINDKHIEIIVRQILSRVRVDSPGDTELLPGELVNRFEYEDINAETLAEGGEASTAHAVLLGITRASLNTSSWLAAASFQETTRVLTEAAASGRIDRLSGLKENVIIGRLIPARCFPHREEPQLSLLTGELEGGESPAVATESA